jgi:hypothetical protein
VLVLTDQSVQVRVPLEIPMPGTKSTASAARGRIVLECTTPGIVEELRRLREAANPDEATSTQPEDIRKRVLSWKLLRIESDLKPVQITPEAVPGEGP